eukprot:TRINITY_DN101144_c0_g1_i1.p1 TRINITY_DN101144_c0_g1~~TRINITY_DN101144_c0_g1_i1.p1  ORF type:complete len:492 (-),score=122.34 TRINITY_DN101144_c0_g1_i1:43-1479(-)
MGGVFCLEQEHPARKGKKARQEARAAGENADVERQVRELVRSNRLATFLAGPYQQGELLTSGRDYLATAAEEITLQFFERLVPLVEHSGTSIRVWPEALDCRAADPGGRAAVLFHYATREGFLAGVDESKPPGQAFHAMAEASKQVTPVLANSAARLMATSQEPGMLPDGALPDIALAMGIPRNQRGGIFCVPLLVPRSCCFASNTGYAHSECIVSMTAHGLQLISAQGRSGLRRVQMERLASGNREAYYRRAGDLGLALLQEGHVIPSLQICRHAADQSAAELHAAPVEALRLRHNLAGVYCMLAQRAEAEKAYRAALDGRKRTLGPDSAATLRTMLLLAALLDEDPQRKGEAQAMYRSVLDLRKAKLGAEHADTVLAMNCLAFSLFKGGVTSQKEEAEQIYKRVLLITESTLGPAHPKTLRALNNAAAVAKDLGNVDEVAILLGRRPKANAKPLPPLTSGVIHVKDDDRDAESQDD